MKGGSKAGHATVWREGFHIPLIGIPVSAVMEECDCCHDVFGISMVTWTGTQMLCEKCLKLVLPE